MIEDNHLIEKKKSPGVGKEDGQRCYKSGSIHQKGNDPSSPSSHFEYAST